MVRRSYSLLSRFVWKKDSPEIVRVQYIQKVVQAIGNTGSGSGYPFPINSHPGRQNRTLGTDARVLQQ